MQIDAHHAGRGVVVSYATKARPNPAAPDVERREQRQGSQSRGNDHRGPALMGIKICMPIKLFAFVTSAFINRLAGAL